MTYRSLHKMKFTGITAILTAALICVMPAAASPQISPWDETLPADAAAGPAQRPASVYFNNLAVKPFGPPEIIQNTMMVPARMLLEGLGYELKWDAAERKMTALHPGKPALVFWADRHEMEIGGKKVMRLPAAPFLANEMIWIPLRLAAEAGGLTVSWDPANRIAIVKDPNALPQFSLTAMAVDGFPDQPVNLRQIFEQKLKANVRVSLIPPDHYRDKVNVMIAAGDLHSIMFIQNPYQYPDGLLESIAVDITDELEAFPRLKNVAADPQNGGNINGNIYGIPRPHDPHDVPFPALRQDWLDVLGLAQPKTLDELYVVLERFTKYDPDGNGKHDTYGMVGYTAWDGLGSFAWVEQAYTGSPGRFSVKDGKVIDHAVSAEEVRALKWLARAYADGLIDKEFPVLSREQSFNRLMENRAGAAALSLADAASLTKDKAAWVPLPAMKADSLSAPIAPWNTQETGTYIITKMSKVEPKVILNWLNRGIEMTVSGAWEQVKELKQADRSAVRSIFGQPDLLIGISSLQAVPEAYRDDYEAAVKEWRSTSYEGTVVPGIAQAWRNGKYAEMNSRLAQNKTKAILGAISIEDWENYTKDLVASDEYREMMAELNALISK